MGRKFPCWGLVLEPGKLAPAPTLRLSRSFDRLRTAAGLHASAVGAAAQSGRTGKGALDSGIRRALLRLRQIAASRRDTARKMDVVIVRARWAHRQKAPVTGTCLHSGQPRRGVLRRRAVGILGAQATAGLGEIGFRLCHLRFVFLSERVESAFGGPLLSRRRRGRDPSVRRPAERFCRSRLETTAPCSRSWRAASRPSSQHARRLWPSPW